MLDVIVESTSDWMSYYVDIMNMLDDVAERSNKTLTEEELDHLDFLCEHGGFEIEDIADANDCGICHTWQEIVYALSDLIATGDRVPIE